METVPGRDNKTMVHVIFQAIGAPLCAQSSYHVIGAGAALFVEQNERPFRVRTGDSRSLAAAHGPQREPLGAAVFKKKDPAVNSASNPCC